MTYVCARPTTLAHGRPMAPGDTVTLTPAARALPDNATAIAEGFLVPAPRPLAPARPRARRTATAARTRRTPTQEASP